MKIQNQGRQGDVLCQPVAELPAGAKCIEKKGRIVLAEGEVTNHFHAIYELDGVSEYEHNGKRYLEVKERATVKHEEHAPMVLEPGVYEVRRQVEEWMDEVRQVTD